MFITHFELSPSIRSSVCQSLLYVRSIKNIAYKNTVNKNIANKNTANKMSPIEGNLKFIRLT